MMPAAGRPVDVSRTWQVIGSLAADIFGYVSDLDALKLLPFSLGSEMYMKQSPN